MRKCLLLLLCSIGLALTGLSYAQGKVYKRVNPDGSVEFTDAPQKGFEPVEIGPVQEYSSPPVKTEKPAKKEEGKEDEEQAKREKYSKVEIDVPEYVDRVEGSIASGLAVSVEVSPKLQFEDTLELYLDGGKVADSQDKSSRISFNLNMEKIFRGEHTLIAEIVDGAASSGRSKSRAKVWAKSKPKVFNVRQPYVRSSEGKPAGIIAKVTKP